MKEKKKNQKGRKKIKEKDIVVKKKWIDNNKNS